MYQYQVPGIYRGIIYTLCNSSDVTSGSFEMLAFSVYEYCTRTVVGFLLGSVPLCRTVCPFSLVCVSVSVPLTIDDGQMASLDRQYR